MKGMGSGEGADSYLKSLVFAFIALGLFIVAVVAAFFGGVGLYFGQGIVEVDVFADKYKFNCDVLVNTTNTENRTNGVCNSFNTSDELDSWTDYQEFRNDLNATIPLYIAATAVIFSLLALVFLFMALKASGLWKGGGTKGKKDEY